MQTLPALQGEWVAGGGVAVALALAALPGEEGAVDPGVAKVAALAGEAGVARGTATGFDGPGLLRAVRTLVAQLQGGSPEPEKGGKMFILNQKSVTF